MLVTNVSVTRTHATCPPDARHCCLHRQAGRQAPQHTQLRTCRHESHQLAANTSRQLPTRAQQGGHPRRNTVHVWQTPERPCPVLCQAQCCIRPRENTRPLLTQQHPQKVLPSKPSGAGSLQAHMHQPPTTCMPHSARTHTPSLLFVPTTALLGGRAHHQLAAAAAAAAVLHCCCCPAGCCAHCCAGCDYCWCRCYAACCQ